MKFKLSTVSAAFFVIVAALFASCNKDNDLGSTILPQGDNVNVVFSDTSLILTRTVKEDSLRTSGVSGLPVSFNLVGANNDPIFGKTIASVYSQMNLSKFNFNYGATSTPDSLILSLALTNYYGDTTSAVHFKVFRMSSVINKDSIYYSNSSLSTSTLIGDAIITINPKDSAVEYGVKKAPSVRIPLSMVLAQELMTNSGGPAYVDQAAFTAFFNGVYITAEPENTVDKGCLFQWDYKSLQSKMALFYKVNSDSDSLVFNYYFDELLRFNTFNHDYTGTDVDNALTNPLTNTGYTYIQAMAGVKTKYQFPFIKSSFDKSTTTINNALLVIQALPNTKYPPNTKLALALVDSSGASQPFSPDNNELTNSSDGIYNSTTGEYSFNVTRYINRIITGEHLDYGLYLRSSSAIVFPNRVQVFGTNNPLGSVKLELTYSKY